MTDHDEICGTWAHAWGHASPRDFAAQYTEDGVYIDHAFRIARSGREAIAGHSAIWHNAVTNFEMTPRQIWTSPGGAFMTWVGTGHFARDLADLAATGADFVCHGGIRLNFDATGKITVSEEYYSTTFAQKGGVETYPLIPAGQPVTPETAG